MDFNCVTLSFVSHQMIETHTKNNFFVASERGEYYCRPKVFPVSKSNSLKENNKIENNLL